MRFTIVYPIHRIKKQGCNGPPRFRKSGYQPGRVFSRSSLADISNCDDPTKSPDSRRVRRIDRAARQATLQSTTTAAIGYKC
eukprot:182381-Amorphochlora_amoeboformis.AAC.1